MGVVKSDDIKKEATNIDSSSKIKVSSDIDYVEQMTFTCDMPAHKVDLESIKYEESVETEKFTSYHIEMSIKTEINDMKFEADIEHESDHEEIKSMKIENSKVDPGNEYMEHTLDDVQVDMEKQNAVQHCRGSSYEYETEDVARHSNNKYEENIKGEKITSYNAEMSIKTEINFEEDIEHGLVHEEIKSLKIENLKIHLGNEYVERTSDWIEVARKSNHKNNIEQHQSLPFTSKDKAKLRVQLNVFHCKLCDFKTKYKQHLLQHHRSKHDDAAEIFHCELCDYKTKNKHKLLEHHKLKHDDAAEIFHCALCDFKTKYKYSSLQHYKFKHDEAAEIFHCELCDYGTKRKDLLSLHHRMKHDDAAKVFHCKLCDYKTKRKDHLVRHHTSKHDDAAHIHHCKLCDYKTKRKDHLVKHHRLIHDDAAEILHCKFCDYKAKSKQYLVRHHTLKHDDAAILHCLLCDFKTKCKRYLSQHHRVQHDSVEIYHCKVCDFKTKHKGNMLQHQRSKHE